MTLVVDASAIAAVVFGEPDGPTVAAHVEGKSLVAPSLLDYELANIAWKKLRRHPERTAEILASTSRVDGLRITRVPVPVADIVALAVRLAPREHRSIRNALSGLTFWRGPSQRCRLRCGKIG